MGHKVNPQIFRLGISVDWNYQLKDPLLANIYVYKMIKNLAIQYSVPYSSYTVRRPSYAKETRNSHLSDQQVLALTHNRNSMILNPFKENTFTFSHLNISYAPSLYLAVFFLDGAAETLRLKRDLPENSLYYLSGRYYHDTHHYYSYFLKQMFFKKRRLITINARYFFTHKTHINLLTSPDIDLSTGQPYDLDNPLFERKDNRLSFHMYPSWLNNSFSYFSYNHRITNIQKNLKILRFLLRYLCKINKVFSKKRLFFFNILITTLLTLLALLPNTLFSKRLFIYVSLCYVYLLSFKYLHLEYNKSIFQSHLFFFYLFNKIVLFSLKKISFFPTDHRLILRFYGLHNRNVNASFLVNYFILKFGQYFSLSEILKPIMYKLQDLYYVRGARLIFSGRLTRKERAAYIIRSYRSMPLSTSNIRIDYASDFKIMKFGVVGIKIYLLCDIKPPYYYFFEFRSYL